MRSKAEWLEELAELLQRRSEGAEWDYVSWALWEKGNHLQLRAGCLRAGAADPGPRSPEVGLRVRINLGRIPPQGYVKKEV